MIEKATFQYDILKGADVQSVFIELGEGPDPAILNLFTLQSRFQTDGKEYDNIVSCSSYNSNPAQ